MGRRAGDQCLGQPHKEAVADLVAMKVVDRLEAVHVDQDHAGGRILAAQAMQMFIQGAPAAQARQRIPFRQIARAFQGQPLLVHVLKRADPLGRMALGFRDQHAPRPYPAPMALRIPHAAFHLQAVAALQAAEIQPAAILGVEAVEAVAAKGKAIGLTGQGLPSHGGADAPLEVRPPQHQRPCLQRRAIAIAAAPEIRLRTARRLAVKAEVVVVQIHRGFIRQRKSSLLYRQTSAGQKESAASPV